MSDELKTLREAKAAAAKLSERERELRAEHGALLRERGDVASAYVPQQEVIAGAERLVDQAAADFASTFALEVVRSCSGYREVRGNGDSREHEVKPHLPRFGDGTLRMEELCGLAPALVKARLAEVIRGSGAAFGLGAEERAKRLAELDAKIAGLEAAHTELVDGAAEVGITLRLLDSVSTGREKAQRTADRAKKAAEDRARGVYPVTTA